MKNEDVEVAMKLEIKFGDIDAAVALGIKSIFIQRKLRSVDRFVKWNAYPLVILTKLNGKVETRNGKYMNNGDVKFTWKKNEIKLVGVK